MEDEDLRFMNNDPEGLKQMSQQPRPIKAESLEVFGMIVGQYRAKISCPSESEVVEMKAIAAWLKSDPSNIDYINKEESEYLDRLLEDYSPKVS
jgi:hypothetical protein